MPLMRYMLQYNANKHVFNDLPKSVFAERRTTEIVWERVPGCWACHRKRPTSELGTTVLVHDELTATCRAETLTTGNISHRLAAVHKVLRSIALQTLCRHR